MKKFYLFLLAAINSMCAMAQNEQVPQWLTALVNENQGLIDSVNWYNPHPAAPYSRTYVVYYNQPLYHADPASARFHMRALITVDTRNDVTKAVNHVYCSGYSIDYPSLVSPDSNFVNDKSSSAEIARRYNANYIQIEHRYFQYSAPDKCWENLDPLTAEEAAADFHNLFNGLKKVLKGKWVMSGASKGGITTLLQHAFYPEDMDVYVPYAAPFFESEKDTTMYKYWYYNGWNKEYLDYFMSIRKKGIAGLFANPGTNTIWPIYYKMNSGGKTSQAAADTLAAVYMGCVAVFGFTAHAYTDTATLRKEMALNDSVMRSYGWTQPNDTVMSFWLAKDTFSLKTFSAWIDTLRKYPDPAQVPARRIEHRRIAPYGISEKAWWGADTLHTGTAMAYEYQSKHELGYYDVRFDDICPNQQEAAAANIFWQTYAGNCRDLGFPFKTVTFSRNLYDRTMEATKNATKPIILIYGENDAWTGAAVKDEFINGTNVQKFILPAQNHYVSFSALTDPAKTAQITAVLDRVLGAPQGMDEVQQPAVQGTKVFRNGQLYIIRDGKTYNVLGALINGTF